MENGKIAGGLMVDLQLPEALRKKSVGGEINDSEFRWEIIVKYSGDLEQYHEQIPFEVEYINENVAIVFLNPADILEFARLPEVEYIEAPRRLWFQLEESRREICLTPLQVQENNRNDNLFGEGVIVAVIDSGIDYAHPDFRKEDGTTRIIGLWDQTLDPLDLQSTEQETGTIYSPPEGYLLGVFFSEEQINEALRQNTRSEQQRLLPSMDYSGHGTHVTGIACGNGQVSNGVYRGVATKADILVVKIGDAEGITFPRTTRLLEAINFVIDFARQRNQPVAINLSFGNNAGPHTGGGIISEYLNREALKWKNCICVGTGNEGTTGRHKEGVLSSNQTEEFSCVFGPEQGSLYMELWKSYEDNFQIELVSPSREIVTIEKNDEGKIRKYDFSDCILVVNYGEPTPFEILQEIYLEWIPKGESLKEGVWTFRFLAGKVVDGRYDLWLPTGANIQLQTRFLNPNVSTTLTTPSSTNRLISVGAFDGNTGEIAAFSGRGYTRNGLQKPDLVAPGVDILSTAPNNSYTVRSGTSMAVPFVTGACALLMEWGIVRGNDGYLYGERMKAFLRAGAVPVGREPVPNSVEGYGSLCIKQSLPES